LVSSRKAPNQSRARDRPRTAEAVPGHYDHEERRVTDRIVSYGISPLGRASMTEAEVRASGRPALVGKRSTDDVEQLG
jgi:hypothetical protein